MKPTYLELYRFLTRGAKGGDDPVSKWLANDPEGVPLVTESSVRMAQPPPDDRCGLPELMIYRVLNGTDGFEEEKREAAWFAILDSNDGREFADNLAAMNEQEYDEKTARAVESTIDRARSAVARKTSGVPVYSLFLVAPSSTGTYLFSLLDIPQSQEALSASYRSTILAVGQEVDSLPFYFEDGISFALAVRREGEGGSRKVELQLKCFLHHEDRELKSASVNGEPMSIVEGEGVAGFAELPETLEFAASVEDGGEFSFGCEIRAR